MNRGLHWISFDRPHGGDSDMASSCASSAPAMYQPAGKGEAERVEVATRKKYSRNLLLHWAHVQGDCRTLSVLFLPVQGPFRQLHRLHVEEMRRPASRRQPLGISPKLTALTFLALFERKVREYSAINLDFPRDPWL